MLEWMCVTGVSGRTGPPHGSGRQKCQAGAMDQRLSGCSGESHSTRLLSLEHMGRSGSVTLKCVFLFGSQGLGLVVTGTMPVFNLTIDGNSQVTLNCWWIIITLNSAVCGSLMPVFVCSESAAFRGDGGRRSSGWAEETHATVQGEVFYTHNLHVLSWATFTF